MQALCLGPFIALAYSHALQYYTYTMHDSGTFWNVVLDYWLPLLVQSKSVCFYVMRLLRSYSFRTLNGRQTTDGHNSVH